MIEHRPIENPWSWGVGITYSKNTQSVLESQFLTVDINMYRDLFKTRLISMQTFFSLNFSGDNRITAVYSDGDTVTSRGSLAGGSLGAQLRFRPHATFGIYSGTSYKYYKAFSQDPVLIPESSDFFELTNYSGVHIYAGISYAL